MTDAGEHAATILLKEADERLRAVLDSVGDGSWDWNIRSGEVFYSDRWIESLGYERKNIPPNVSFWESLIHPDDEERVWANLSPHIEGTTERFMRRASGDYRWTLDRGRVVERDADGEALRMVGTNCVISLDRQGLTRREPQTEAANPQAQQRLAVPLSQDRLVAALEFVLATPELREKLAERAYSPEFWPEFFAIHDSIKASDS